MSTRTKIFIVLTLSLLIAPGLSWAKAQRLYVSTVPRDAKVRILNINPRFTQGLRLPAGRYHLEVSKPGYQTQRQWVELKQSSLNIEIKLEPVRYALYIKSTPANANIMIRNIKPAFKQGIALPPGRYDVEISAKGYQTYRNWVELKNQDYHLEAKLEAEKTLRAQALPAANEVSTSLAEALQQAYQLFINISPADAQIRFVDPPRPFHQNMRLPPGRYTLELSRDGYQPLHQTLEIVDADVHWEASLPPLDEQFALFIDTYPEDAKIKLLNWSEEYTLGMRLPPGRYALEVSHEGYSTRQDWVEIGNHDVSSFIRLSEPGRCFISADQQTQVDIEFYADLVKAHYRRKGREASEDYELIGQRSGELLHLLGKMANEDIRVNMGLLEDTLHLDLGGQRQVLSQVDCTN